MRKIKELLKTSLEALWRHFFINMLVVFISGIIISSGYIYQTNWNLGETEILPEYQQSRSNADITEEFFNELSLLSFTPNTPLESYLKSSVTAIYNEVTESGALAFEILSGINQILFFGNPGSSVVIFVMTLLNALVWIFVRNILIIGQSRYFLEHRYYNETRADRLFFIYRTKTTKNAAKIMFLRSVKQALWDLTIIGGGIKYYEYSMIPYILAENPNIPTKEAFALSKKLTNGCKKKLFLVSLTMLPFYLADGLTFHLSTLFFIDPLRACIYAEIYSDLRGNFAGDSRFIDSALFENKNDLEYYPDDLCPTPHAESRMWLATDWDRTYGGDTIILFFFFFSLIGWTWEVLVHLISSGVFVNKGTMHGPWLPIYGIGGFIIVYGLKSLRKRPGLLFAGACISCGVIEYLTSWLLEKLFNMRWWDYTGYFMNLNGRIALEGLLVFGLAGFAMTYFVAPVTENLLKKIPEKIRRFLCIVLLFLFFSDLIYSAMNPNTGYGITEGFDVIRFEIT